MRIATAGLSLVFWAGLGVSLVAAQPPPSTSSDPTGSRGADGGLPGDCNNNGIVDRTDFATFALILQGPNCGGSGICRCYDLNGDHCVDPRDFAALQVAFGAVQDTPEPPPSNIFVLQLADYRVRCAAADGDVQAAFLGFFRLFA